MIKTLIVDDEEWIRLGLREQIDWDSLGMEVIGEAPNGEAAIEIIDEAIPEIVITDIRMPKVDGISLMEYIHSKFPNILIIVISGYSEFEYAKKAITFSAFDYILKPIEEDILEETLKNAVKKLKDDKNKKNDILSLKADLSISSVFIKEKLLTNLVLGSNFKDIKSDIEKTGLKFRCPRMVVLVFKAANFSEVANRRYCSDSGLTGFALSNVIWELIEDKDNSVLFRNYTKTDEIILIKGFNSEEYITIIEEIYLVCNNAIDKVRELIEFELYIGIGGEFTSLKDACKSYGQAVEAVQNAGILHNNRIVHIDEISSRNEYFIYPDDKEKALLHYLESGYKSQAFILIDDLFSEVEGNKAVIPQSIRNTVLELIISINKLLKKYEGSMEELMSDRHIADKIMNDLFTSHDLKEWFKDAAIKVIELIAVYKRTGSKKIINQIAEYINKHYSEGINLNDISEMFFINSAYLSRIFKSEIGQNFNDYLSKLRMDAAVKLLKDETLKMTDISEMIGYENVNYFLKKFKECFNCTPTEYRKKNK